MTYTNMKSNVTKEVYVGYKNLFNVYNYGDWVVQSIL